ncbi:MAG TPA: shikimate dehydrogenase [Vicinamibacteria bacterium]
MSLTEETMAGLIDRMEELAPVADLFEIRADLVLDLDLLTLMRAKTRPLLLTCLPMAEGGRWLDDDPQRRLMLLEGVKRGFDYVDVNFRSKYVDVMMEKSGRGLVVSYHDLEGTPADLDSLYRQMADCGADIVKIAVVPRSVAEVGRLLSFAQRVAQRGGPPLIALAMGPLGIITRVAAGRYGAPFTFASAAEGAEAAPGQLPAAQMADLYRVRSVNPATRVYGVLGSDVARSLSPVLHNRAFEARGLDAVYVPLQAEALEPFVHALPALDLAGFSVTRPYKVAMLDHLDAVEEASAVCGSVNTVVVKNGALQGSTTDGAGVLIPLRRRIEVKGRSVVILGAGGAARAAALALRRKGARVTLLGRDLLQAGDAAQAAGCAHGALKDVATYPWDILINATPIGSATNPDLTPVPARLHRPGTIVFDMVYDPLATRFLREAQAAGCTIIDGLEMLLSQAIVQFETWTGLEAPVEAMRSAALYLVQEQEG